MDTMGWIIQGHGSLLKHFEKMICFLVDDDTPVLEKKNWKKWWFLSQPINNGGWTSRAGGEVIQVDLRKWVAKKTMRLYCTQWIRVAFVKLPPLVVKRSSSNSSTQYIASTCTTYIWSFLLTNVEQHNYIDNRQFLFDWLSDPGRQLFVECFCCGVVTESVEVTSIFSTLRVVHVLHAFLGGPTIQPMPCQKKFRTARRWEVCLCFQPWTWFHQRHLDEQKTGERKTREAQLID